MKNIKYTPKLNDSNSFTCYWALVANPSGSVIIVGPFGNEKEMKHEFQRTGYDSRKAGFYKGFFPYPEGAKISTPIVREAMTHAPAVAETA